MKCIACPFVFESTQKVHVSTESTKREGSWFLPRTARLGNVETWRVSRLDKSFGARKWCGLSCRPNCQETIYETTTFAPISSLRTSCYRQLNILNEALRLLPHGHAGWLSGRSTDGAGATLIAAVH